MRVTVALSCAICLNESSGAEAGPWISLAACGHIYHSGCIKRWTSPPRGSGQRRSNLCPNCRSAIVHPGGRTDLTRFRKLIFDSEPVEHPSDVSSSPVKEPAKKRRAVIDDDDEEEEVEARAVVGGEEDPGTESESDEENARPARRYEGARAANAGNADAGGASHAGGAAAHERDSAQEISTLRAQIQELKAAQRTSREKVAHLEHQLAVQAEREADASNTFEEQLREAQDERHAADQRVKSVNEAMKEEKELVKKLKEDKKGLGRSLKMEVEKVGKLREQVARLTSELSSLKESNSLLSATHAKLLESSRELEAEAESRDTKHDRLKNTVTRLLETKATYEAKLVKKRERIEKLEAQLALNLRTTASKAKGKGRAEDQDEDLSNQESLIHAHTAGSSKPKPAAVGEKRKRVITIENDEDSLMVLDEIGGTGGGVDSLNFSDLDAGLLGAGKGRPLLPKKLTQPQPKSPAKTVSRFFKPAAESGKSASAAADKWTDMALGLGKGSGSKSGNVAVAAKKKVKMGF